VGVVVPPRKEGETRAEEGDGSRRPRPNEKKKSLTRCWVTLDCAKRKREHLKGINLEHLERKKTTARKKRKKTSRKEGPYGVIPFKVCIPYERIRHMKTRREDQFAVRRQKTKEVDVGESPVPESTLKPRRDRCQDKRTIGKKGAGSRRGCMRRRRDKEGGNTLGNTPSIFWGKREKTGAR